MGQSMWLVRAACVAMGLSPGVQAATLSTSSAWVSGLSYHLEDLDPNDGIAPWVRFNGVGVSAGYFTQQTGSNHITLGDDVFARPIGSLSSPSGDVVVGSSGTAYTGSLKLDASSVQNLNGTGVQPADWVYYDSAGVLSPYGSGGDDSGLPWPL